VGRTSRLHRASGLLAARAWFRRLAVSGGLTVAAVGLAGVSAPLVHAAQTLTVTTFGDPTSGTACPASGSNVCSLRAAIIQANTDDDGDTISLPAGTYTLASGSYYDQITAPMTITGASAATTFIDGASADGGYSTFSTNGNAGTVNFSDLTFQNANITNEAGVFSTPNTGGPPSTTNVINVTDVAFVGNAGYTGVWYNGSSGITTMTDVTFSGNEAIPSGGFAAVLRNDGSLTLVNVTIADNVAEAGSGAPGGIENTGTLSITNSDIVGNTGDGTGVGSVGGIYLAGGTVDVVNSIISGNTDDDDSATNCTAHVTTTSHDIENGTTCGFTGTGDLNANPDLGALASNGGPLQTEALLSGSPAIQAALKSSCPTDDERGYVRITGSDTTCDIGAYEYGAGPVTTSTPTPTATPTPAGGSAGVPVPTSGATQPGAGSGSLWAVLLLIAGLGLAAASRLVRRRDSAV
jgi:hypothetical protein